jgi:hypothetical protein
MTPRQDSPATNNKMIVSSPREAYKISPLRNRARALWDASSKAPLQPDADGNVTTGTIETYIHYSIRSDNLQWAICLEDLRCVTLYDPLTHATP